MPGHRDACIDHPVPANTTGEIAVLTSNWAYIKSSLKKGLLLIVFNRYT